MKKYISIKKVLFLLLALFYAQFLLAQNMSINNTGNAPDASSMLDVSSDTKGLLIPRISLTLTTTASPVTSPANSLLVYNTNTAGDVTPGYYYWYSAQAKWVRVGKTYTASNGLNIASDDIKLGGTLIQNTTITQGNFNLTFNGSGTGTFDIQDAGVSKFFVKDGGFIGINTNSPGYQFTIGGTGNIFGVDNTATFLAKNSAGTYESYLWPRWSDNMMYLNYGSAGFNIRNNSSTSTMFMTNAGNVGIATATPSSLFSVGASSQFQVNSSGDMIKIKGVTYSWPTTYTSSVSSSLKNDGSGNLSWGPVGWTRICDVTLADATSYNLTGLDGNVDIAYKIIMMGYHDNPAPADLRYCWVSVNGDATAANYSYGMDCYWLYRGGYGWSYDIYTIGGIFIWVTDANVNPNYCESETILSGFTGDKRHAVTRYSLGLSGKDIVANLSVGLWTNTATNITSLLFQWSGASGVNGFHGRLIVYALR